jgi:Raf kinase inhibitor-like YbhB/YbcL family protein
MIHRLASVALAGSAALVSLTGLRAEAQVAAAGLSVSSPAFAGGSPIPMAYTCDAEGKSPPLEWSNLPPATRAVAIVVDDPDAPHGPFVHWILFDVSPGATKLAEGATKAPPLGAAQGKNSKDQTGWTPPCPPSGVHHYHFKVYALGKAIPLSQPTIEDLKRAMAGQVLAEGETIGTYERVKK